MKDESMLDVEQYCVPCHAYVVHGSMLDVRGQGLGLMIEFDQNRGKHFVKTL